MANCEVVDGVEIDEAELASMEEMMREAAYKEQDPQLPQHSYRSVNSNMTDAAPITRSSLAVLTGDENDLLSESPVF